MYTEIRGLLQEPPDQGLHGLSYKGEALLSSQGLTIVFLKSVCTNNFILTLYLIKMPFHTFTVDTTFLNGFSYSIQLYIKIQCFVCTGQINIFFILLLNSPDKQSDHNDLFEKILLEISVVEVSKLHR